MLHPLEKELVKVTKVKPDKFEDRQDFLASILKAMDKLSDDDFDSLSDQAAEWHTKQAVPAMNKKKPIPDFVEPEPEETPEDDESDPTDDNPEDDTEADPGDDAETDPQEAAEAESDNEATEAAEDAEVEKPKKVKGKAKAKLAPVDEDEEAPKPKKAQRNYAGLSGATDRFGVIIGTKTSDAVAMYVKGATSKQIAAELGGRYYNILTKLAKDGHKVENIEGAWKLTHKDDIGVEKPKKKKAK